MPIVQHLQQDIEDIRVGFFNLIKQENGIWLAPDLLAELSSLLIADIARRGSDQL